MEFLEVIDSEDQQLMPAHSNKYPSQGVKRTHLDLDSDSGQGSCDSPSLLSEKCEEPWANPFPFHTSEGIEKPESPETNGTPTWEPQSTGLEGKMPYFHAGGSKSAWLLPEPPGQHNPRSSYHNISDVCKLAMGSAGASSTSVDKTDTHALKSSKTAETGGEEKAGKQREFESSHSQTDPDTAWLLPQEETPFISAKLLDYVEIHKINKDGALSLLPKQKENSNQTEEPSTLETSKEYAKVSRVMDNHILVLVQGPCPQNLALFEEPATGAPSSLQQNQAEKDLASFTASPSNCKLQMGGLDYLDPACFKHSFQG